MPIPASIVERVETFARNLESYLRADYKEAQLRREFLDPLFEALGWDVANRSGYAEAYKDVVHEDALRISGVGISSPDYSFRIGGTRKFFVEAKKPSVYLKDDPEPAAQLRRYSWSAKLPLGIVTDFQEFAIYDTRVRPREGDKASVARIFYCTFEQFAEKWDEIAGIFSREAILRGSFDKFAAATKGKRGTAEFDEAFLEDLEGWRRRLAENLALRNRDLTQRDLNFAVQRTLDRIIFLRIAEDRGIEAYGQLQALLAGPKIYPRLCEIFERADFRYNSGLFHFAAEKGRDESPDRLTLGLTIDDAALKEILGALYYPKCPYAFAVIPAEFLGHVYEQFLGNVIYLTDGHRAHVDQKPEVRKAGGVYYTPDYIVDYIVRQTLGPLVEGKNPRQLEKLRVLDPACGSGSFLLGAYAFLLDWHLRYYLAHDPGAWAQKKNPPIYETNPTPAAASSGAPLASGPSPLARSWSLTTSERKRILTACIYGVDIDAQAVEVTKLSLLLKVLEGEARELRGGRQLDFHRVLPDLGHNIKCGNSLIGPDFYQQPNLPDFDEEARYKINVFDWEAEFASIMRAGGFDAVIGNPPYGADYTDEEKNYFQASFVFKKGKPETYIFFFEKAVLLMRRNGMLGFITPNAWLTNFYGSQIRSFLLHECQPIEFVDLEKTKVFEGAVVDTAISIFVRDHKAGAKTRISRGTKERTIKPFCELDPKLWEADEEKLINLQANPVELDLLGKLEASHQTFGDWVEYSQGAIPYKTKQDGAKNAYISSHSQPGWIPLLENAAQVTRYHVAPPNSCIHYGPWLWCAREPRFFSQPKILFHRVRKKLARQLVGALDESGAVNRHSLSNLILRSGHSRNVLLTVLALFNSTLANWWFVKRFGLLMEVGGFKAAAIPLPRDSDRATKSLAPLVERMLKLHTDLAAAKSPEVQTHLQREIAATDRAIDQLVYQLYELTPEEIALVEQATAPAAAPEPDEAPAEPAPLPSAANYVQAEADAAHHYFVKEPTPENP